LRSPFLAPRVLATNVREVTYLDARMIETFDTEVCMAEAKTTTDHNEIRRWVEERGGHPARVRGTGDKDGGGLLRIDYPGYSGEKELQEISWSEFFDAFDKNDLAFLYQAEKDSRFSKLINRDQ
jgi:hypothetical protein